MEPLGRYGAIVDILVDVFVEVVLGFVLSGKHQDKDIQKVNALVLCLLGFLVVYVSMELLLVVVGFMDTEECGHSYLKTCTCPYRVGFLQYMVIQISAVVEEDVGYVTAVVDSARVLGLLVLGKCLVLVDGDHLHVLVDVPVVMQVEWAWFVFLIINLYTL